MDSHAHADIVASEVREFREASDASDSKWQENTQRLVAAARDKAQCIQAALTRLHADALKASEAIGDFSAQLRAEIDAHEEALKATLAQACAAHTERLELQAVELDSLILKLGNRDSVKDAGTWKSALGAARDQYTIAIVELPLLPSEVRFNAAGVRDTARTCMQQALVQSSFIWQLQQVLSVDKTIIRLRRTPTEVIVKAYFPVSAPQLAVSASSLLPPRSARGEIPTAAVEPGAEACDEDELALQFVAQVNRHISITLSSFSESFNNGVSLRLEDLCAARSSRKMTHTASGFDIEACVQFSGADLLLFEESKYCVICVLTNCGQSVYSRFDLTSKAAAAQAGV